MNAKTPEERDAALKQLNILSGADQKGYYHPTVVGGGVNPETGMTNPQTLAVVDTRTGQVSTQQPGKPKPSYAEYEKAYLKTRKGTSPEQIKKDYAELYGKA